MIKTNQLGDVFLQNKLKQSMFIKKLKRKKETINFTNFIADINLFLFVELISLPKAPENAKKKMKKKYQDRKN